MMHTHIEICGILLLSAAFAWCGTLETRCPDVLMEEVPLGVPVALRLPNGGYYSVRNASSRPLRVRFLPVVPSYCERTPGLPAYTAVTNLAWVGVTPAVAEVPPMAEAEALVTIRVPDEPQHAGRHYEFWLKAEALQGMGGVALLTRVRVNTAANTDGRELKLEKPRKPRVVAAQRPVWRRLMFWRKE